MKRLWVIVIFLTLGFSSTARGQGLQTFELQSPVIKPPEMIAEKYTCHGADVNPELNFVNVPNGTKSMALIVDDPDAPEGTWVHWVIYNIPPDKTKIVENLKVGVEGLNDFGVFRYRGPCPPNKKVHHYSFRVYALKEELELNEGFIKSDLERAMKGKILAQAELVATYKNP